MITRSLNQSYRNFSKGLDNVNDPEILKAGFTPACRNVRFDSTGVVKRGGTKKMHTTAVDAEIVSIFDFTDRRGNSLALFIESDATVWKYNALDNKSDISALVVLSAAYSYQHGSFWKGAVDYLMLTDFTNYVKKISYTDSVAENAVYDVRGLFYLNNTLYSATMSNSTTGIKSYTYKYIEIGTLGVESTKVHATASNSILASGNNRHIYYWNGSSWADLGIVLGAIVPQCIRKIGSNYYTGFGGLNPLYSSYTSKLFIYYSAAWNADEPFTSLGIAGNFGTDVGENIFDIYNVSETEIYVCGVVNRLDGETQKYSAFIGKKTANTVGSCSQLFLSTESTTFHYLSSISYVDATHIYFAGKSEASGSIGVYIWNGATLSLLAVVDSVLNTISVKAFSSTSIFALDSSALYSYNGSVFVKVAVPISGVSFQSMYAVSANEIYIGTNNDGVYIYDGSSIKQLQDITLSTLNLGDRLPTETSAKTTTVTGAGTTTVDVTSTVGLYPGCFLVHADITAGTYIVSITDGNTCVVSNTVSAGDKTSTAIIYAPRAKYIETYNNMVFLGYLNYQGADRTTEVAVSEVGDIDDWRDPDATDAGLAGYRIFQFDTGQNTYISGMKSINSVLAVFTTKSVWAINGYAPTSDAMSVKRLAEVGCIAPESVQRVSTSTGDILVWLSSEGFFATDGSSVFPVSRQLEYDFASALVSNARAVYDKENREYRCAVPSTSASTGNDVTLVLNLDTMGWSESVYTQSITAMGKYGEQIFIAGADKILREESEDYATDDITVAGVAGTAITMYYDLPVNPDRQMIEYELRKLYAQYDGTGTCTLEVYKDGVLQKTISAVAQDTLQRTSVKGKNFIVRITYAANDLTFALYAIECSLKILKER